MRVVLLCRNLRVAGAHSVGINFVKSLSTVAPSHQFMVVATRGAGFEDIDLPQGSELFFFEDTVNMLTQFKFDTFILPRKIKGFNPDIIFAMGNYGLTMPVFKQAILFHQAQLVYPYKHCARDTVTSKLKWRILKWRVRQCLKYTHTVFCQTPVTMNRFHREFGFPINRIRIMPNALSELVRVGTEHTGTPSVFRGHSSFHLFFLTKFYAHKNLEVLIDIFRHYKEQMDNVRCIVTVEAGQAPTAPRFLSDINRYGLQEQIVNVGPLRQTELGSYFRNSDALFFPTLLESFSSTYLEAMHFDLPILTSDFDFARYICGDAALYFNPWDPHDIVEKILAMKADKSLREELKEKGRRRLGMFPKSWEEITKNVIRELEAIAEKN